MNKDNCLKLKNGGYGLVLKSGINTVFIPTIKALAKKAAEGARILQVMEDGVITAHWYDNYNTSGDFHTELMRFDNNLLLDIMDKEKRNAIRAKNGLMEIE